MFTATQRSSGGATNLNQILAHEARLNRLHRLFKTHFNVTEPSLVLEPYLYLGNCISAHDIHRLSRLGIRYVLNVAKRDVEVCPYYPNEMRTLTIDLRDDDRENILRAFDQAFAFIDEARRVKSRVLVHCSHGQSRSPAIVIGYLMRSYNISLEHCLSHVVKARPCIIPNDGFLKQLILYDRFLVERRRQQQEAAVMQVLKSAIPTEIPTQHHPSVAPQPPQPPAPTVLTPPQRPPLSASDTTNISSVDSSSLGLTSASSIQTSASSIQTSASSIQTSASNSSIQVIAIQVSSKESSPEKIEVIPIQKVLTDDENVVKCTKKPIDKTEEKLDAKTSSKPRLESSSSHKSLRPKQRSSLKKKSKDTKQSSPGMPRSNTANFNRLNVNHHHHPSFDLTPQQWDFINNYPANYGGSNEYVKTNYITEIYDRATNRFIPTTCY